MARNERIAKYRRWTLSKTRVFETCRFGLIWRGFTDTPALDHPFMSIGFASCIPEFRIGSRNVHRLLVTTIMVALKYVEDMNYRNSYFARVGGLTAKEMNTLEFEFLFLMKFKFHVSVFESYCSHLEREVSIGGGYQIEKKLGILFMCYLLANNFSSFTALDQI